MPGRKTVLYEKNSYCHIYFWYFSYSIFRKAQEIEIKDVVEAPKEPITKYGIASYYAKKFQGRKTFTDAIYDSRLLTGACNVLPMGTMVKVTNLQNDRTVVVEINDHLAKTNKRLIDLTYTAAKTLGYIGRGITKVKVEVLGKLKKQKITKIKKSGSKAHKSTLKIKKHGKYVIIKEDVNAH
ncbi:MAG: hypothetical protein NVS3B19_05600 [Ginsengibacter sp.]